MGYVSLVEDIYDSFCESLPFSSSTQKLTPATRSRPAKEHSEYHRNIIIEAISNILRNPASAQHRKHWEDHIQVVDGLLKILNIDESISKQEFLLSRHELIDYLERHGATTPSPASLCKLRDTFGDLLDRFRLVRTLIHNAYNEQIPASKVSEYITKDEWHFLQDLDSAYESESQKLRALDTLLRHFTTLNDKFVRYSADFRPAISDLNRFTLTDEQESLVQRDYYGALRVLGSSGSGKTSILLQRAIRLAKEHPDKSIYIFTINAALANDLQKHIQCLCARELPNLFVESLQIFIRRLAEQFLPHSHEHLRIRDELSGETIADKQSWADFCNKSHASRLINKLTTVVGSREMAVDYFYDELTYITTALSRSQLRDYLKLDRKSRLGFPLQQRHREIVLELLLAWDDWLSEGALREPDNWAHLLCDSFFNDEQLLAMQQQSPVDFALIDEFQDFSTIELRIVERYVSSQDSLNRLFLVGDMHQKVTAKHHDTRLAGLNFQGKSSRLSKSLRNTRQIIRAASQIPKNFKVVLEDQVDLVSPEEAIWDGPRPQAFRFSDDSHAKSIIKIARKATQSFPNSSIAIVTENADLLSELRTLLPHWQFLCRNEDRPSESYSAAQGHPAKVLSRMNTVKGLEFDTVIVADLSESILPPETRPGDERWRDASLVYTAITRARSRLYITYCGRPSMFLKVMRELIDGDIISEAQELNMNWSIEFQ